MRERALIERLLKPLATHPAARALADDAAVLAPAPGRHLVFTHDVLAAGIHYLPEDRAADVAWKLLAVNLSDLAATGARPIGVLLGLGLSRSEDDMWLEAFTAGLGAALRRWDVALLGGDTVSGLDQAVLGLTAIGEVEPGHALARSGARPGDGLWVSGTIGDAGLGLAIARGDAAPDAALLARFHRPEPRLALGQALAGIATAAMDVSDGLLIDATRLAQASGVAITIELALLPLSDAATACTARTNAALLERATAGDDYELLFAVPFEAEAELQRIATSTATPVTRIGRVEPGAGLQVRGLAGEVLHPTRLGWEH